MKKIMYLLLFFTFSCSFFKKDKEFDIKQFYKDNAQVEKVKLNKISFLLASKYELDNRIVEDFLMNYLEEYDNYSYQLISYEAINKEEVTAKATLSIPDFIRSQEKDSGLSAKIISQLIMDYWSLSPDNELEIINSRLDDLENKIDNIND